ncbi:SHOCT domain-containing protein [Novosphingobium sp.]|uniref:SHOCT domain-containing protein n=1 Tax=Novosphingobium sp. TaxID=1874826 RepID=UPI00286B891D|nr:SHOCT domain-containing protein [Novosphingobium sp.]
MADWIEQLERLSQLHKAGALTDEEFAAQKARVMALAAAPDASRAPEPEPAAPAAAEWDSAAYVADAPRSTAAKWALIGLPVALVLAGAAWFGSTLIGPKSDPGLSGAATAAPLASAAAAASAAPSEEAALPASLDETLTYAAANNCKAAGALEAIYKKLDSAAGLGSANGITVRLDAFDSPLALNVKNGTDADGIETRHAWLRFPEGTTWHGLKLSRLTSTSTLEPESDAGAYEQAMTFLDQPDKVRSTFARLGFGAPRAPGFSELNDQDCKGSMQIVAISGGSALVCSWSC